MVRHSLVAGVVRASIFPPLGHGYHLSYHRGGILRVGGPPLIVELRSRTIRRRAGRRTARGASVGSQLESYRQNTPSDREWLQRSACAHLGVWIGVRSAENRVLEGIRVHRVGTGFASPRRLI
jgi:hypothetical protein